MFKVITDGKWRATLLLEGNNLVWLLKEASRRSEVTMKHIYYREPKNLNNGPIVLVVTGAVKAQVEFFAEICEKHEAKVTFLNDAARLF